MDWQGRASQLINLIDPERSFRAGEFEALDDSAWAALVLDLRAKAGTDHAAENATLRAQLVATSAKAAAEHAAKAAGLTDDQIAALSRA